MRVNGLHMLEIFVMNTNGRWPGQWWGRLLALLGGLLLLSLQTGCANGPNANPRDPLEPMNRHIARFNDDLDRVALKPVATVYKAAVPPLVRTGVSNFFNNVSDVGSLFNNVLQLKPKASAEMLVRVGVNTTFGLGGILNVASELHLERYPEDFGQTLGRWGVPTGPYIVLPILGPSTLRDTTALVVDYKGDVTGYVDPIVGRTALSALRVVNIRSNLLSLGSMLDEASLDKYLFTRDAYFQRRRSQIADGEDTEEPEAPEPK